MEKQEKVKYVLSLDRSDMDIIFDSLHTNYIHLDTIKKSCRNEPTMMDGELVSNKMKRVWELYAEMAKIIVEGKKNADEY